MKKLKLFFACLLMAVLSIGQVWATDIIIDLDLTQASTYPSGFPTTTGTASGTYTLGGYSFTISAPAAIYKHSSGYLMLTGINSTNESTAACITLPAIADYKLTEVKVTPTSSGSTAVKLGVRSNYTTAVSGGSDWTYQQGASNAKTWTLTGTAANTSYKLYVVKASGSGTKNCQIAGLKLTYEPASSSTPSVTPSPTSLTFDAVEAGASAPDAKTFTITGSNLTSALTVSSTNTSFYTCAVTAGSLTPTSKSVSATITVTPQAAITESAGTKEANITISGGGLTSNVNVALSTTVTAPAHVYQYTHDFTNIEGFSSWGNSYSTSHNIDYDIYNGHAGNDDHVYFAGASKQTSNITNMPVAKNSSVDLVLDDPDKYISTVKFVCKQWTNKTKTVTLKYSTDGGANYAVLTPSVSESFTTATTSATINLECLSLPAKTNAVQLVSSGTADNQVGISSVSFDLVDKQTYTINKVVTGCTLSVTNGTSAITSAEAGDEVYVSITETAEGYENPELTVKDAGDHIIAVNNGKFTMPAEAVTVTAAATKKQYTVTLAATNGKIQVGGVEKESITVAHGETAQLTAVANDNYAFSSWATEDAGISLGSTTVSPMTITVTGAGTVTATFVSTAKLNPGFVWSAASAEAVKGQAASLPTLTTNPYSLTPTYVSTNTDVAEIDGDGAVTIKAVGSTTIKATYAEGETYAACEAAYTLTVKGRVTWHVIKGGVDDDSEYADYAKDVVPTKPTGITSCHSSISLVGWTTAEYAKSDDAPTTLYTDNVPAVTDNAEYYAVWANVEEGGWNEITSVANLTAGTYAIYADGYFLKAEISDKNRYNNGGDGTNIVSEGKLTSAPAAACQWVLSINSSSKYVFNNGDNYAGALDEKNKGALLTDETSDFAQWTITRPSTEFVIENVGRAASSTDYSNAYLRQNGASGWATYASSTGSAPRFFKYSAGSASGYTTNCIPPLTVAAPTFSPDGSAAYYTSAQTVTITCATGGATIYYSLDGSDPSIEYTEPITISETKTLKAKAVLSEVSSTITEATYTINLPLSTIQAIIDKANAVGGTATDVQVSFTNWVVSAISADGKTVYVTDGTKGFAIYNGSANMGFAVLDKLNGTIDCQVKKYSDFAELLGVSASSFGAGLTHDGTLSPKAATIQGLTASDNGVLVTISDVTCDEDKDLLDEDSYYLTPVTWLYANAVTDLEPNKMYNVTGVFIYNNNIAPRNAADIVKLSKEQPTITWYEDYTIAAAIGESYSLDSKDDAFAPVCVANSTGSKSYESSDPEIATIDENGVITILKNGVTTITCTVAEDDDYVQGSKSFTLKVGVDEATWVAKDWADDEEINANTNFEDKDDKHYATIAADANVSLTWSKAEGSNVPAYNNNDKDARLYNKTTLQIKSSNSKIITKVTFTFTETSTTTYSGTLDASDGTYNTSTYEWTGFSNDITFTNKNSSQQTRIKSINIEYMNGITSSLKIDDINLNMTEPAGQAIAYTSNRTNPTIVYSDYDDEVIAINEGVVTPVAIGQTTVKASIAAEAPYSSVVTTFKVVVSSGTEVVDYVVILAEKDGVWYALTNTQGTASNSLAGLVVEYDAVGQKILDLTPEQQASITWKRTVDGVTAKFQDASNKFLTGNSTSTNLSVANNVCTWTKNENNYLQGERTFLFHKSNGYFRCYTSSTAGVSEMPVVIPSTDIFMNRTEIRDNLTEGKMGTICPKKEVKYPTGASFYTLTYKEVQAGMPYKVFFDEIAEGASLEAGKPYLFVADGETITGVKVGDEAEHTAGISNNSYNGFYGILTDNYQLYVENQSDVDNYKYYIIYNNEIRLCGLGYFSVPAERAYLDMSQMPEEPVAQAPGRRRVCLTNPAANAPTDIDAINASEKPMKLMIDGQLYILRGEKMFDATGRLVK